MKTLQDVLDKTNELFPWEQFDTRDIRNEIITELFDINQNQKEWNAIPICDWNTDLKNVIDKHLTTTK